MNRKIRKRLIAGGHALASDEPSAAADPRLAATTTIGGELFDVSLFNCESNSVLP